MKLTKQELHILEHALGLTYEEKAYRNHFVTSKGCDDYNICEKLVEKGLMIQRKYPFNEIHESFLYTVTEEGKRETRANKGAEK